MPKIRTFLDSGILIAAARGDRELRERAFAILDDPDRHFVASDFVRLEVLPKAVYHRSQDEVVFYNAFFAAVRQTVYSTKRLVQRVEREAESFGLSAVDSLHVAAAKQAKCQEFITTERSTKPMFRVIGLKIVSIRPTS